MSQLQRVQILLESTQRRALAKIAKREKKSTSAVLREIVDRGLERAIHQDLRWREALGELRRIRAMNLKRGVHHRNFVAEARAERGRQMERAWRKSS